MKKYITVLAAACVAVGIVSTASGAVRVHNVNHLCGWVEKGGDRATFNDFSIAKKHRHDVKFCLVAKQVRGVKGIPGAPGPAGPVGAQGPEGDRGFMGLQGDMGVQGIQGNVGPAGPLGPQGEKGEPGAAGEQGIQGEPGTTGAQGEPGAKGDQGDPGARGEQGIQGEIGPSGAQGEAGPAGPAGPQGDAGPAGPVGPAGPAGPAGPKGDPGLDGSAIITSTDSHTSGSKQFTVDCPVGSVALSGGYNIQGSVTASYRSDHNGDPAGSTSWTIIQTSGSALSGTAYAYCIAAS